MRKGERIDPLLAKIAAIWKQRPDLRLLQLLLNHLDDYDPYFIEDDELNAALDKYLLERRPGGGAGRDMHSCPDCGQACYCQGDIDDLMWDDDSEEAIGCTHYEECEAIEEEKGVEG